MRNNTMTGPIFLSAEDSDQIRQNILNPSIEYIRERNDYFERLASSMIIHTEGLNTTVEFEDLDLSGLDAILEEEFAVVSAKSLEQMSDYVSTTAKVTFVSMSQRIELPKEAMYQDFIVDMPNNRYFCKKIEEKTEHQGCDLTEAA